MISKCKSGDALLSVDDSAVTGCACNIKITDGIRRQADACVLGMPRPCEHAGHDVAGSEAEGIRIIRMRERLVWVTNVPYLKIV